MEIYTLHSKCLPNRLIGKSGERKHVLQLVETTSVKTTEKKEVKKKEKSDSKYQPILIYHRTKGKKFL